MPLPGSGGFSSHEGSDSGHVSPPRGSLEVPAFQLFWNNVSDKSIWFRYLLPITRVLQVGELQTEVFFQVLCSLPRSHTDSNFSVRKRGIFSHKSPARLPTPASQAAAEGREFAVYWETCGLWLVLTQRIVVQSNSLSQWVSLLHFLIHLVHKHLLNTYRGPDTLLGAGCRVVRKRPNPAYGTYVVVVARQKPCK